MNLGNYIKGKIEFRKKEIADTSEDIVSCTRCKQFARRKDVEFNSKFELYNYKRICNNCCEIIDRRNDFESFKNQKPSK
jgi:hypothetical protein